MTPFADDASLDAIAALANDTRYGLSAKIWSRDIRTVHELVGLLEVLQSERLTQGPAITRFEQEFAAAVDAPYAVAFSSGTAALHAAAYVAGLGPGDELLTSAITFAASATCAAYVGATPVFADIDPATWNVSAQTLTAALTEHTRAVVPVHFTGLPLPMAEIRAAVFNAVKSFGVPENRDVVKSVARASVRVAKAVRPFAASETGQAKTTVAKGPRRASGGKSRAQRRGRSRA